MTVSLQMTNESKRMLVELSHVLDKNHIEAALGAGADLIRDAAQRNIGSRGSGKMRGGIISRIDKRTRKPSAYITGDYRKIGGQARHFHLLEYGTKDARTSKGKILYSKKTGKFFGKSVKKMPGIGFMRRAADSQKMRATKKIEGVMFRIAMKKLRKYR